MIGMSRANRHGEVEGLPNFMSEQLSQLVFGLDGQLPADQLEALPADLRERLSSPEFIAQARQQIREQRRVTGELPRTGRRESKVQPIGLHSFGNRANRKERRRMQAALRG